MRSEPRRMRGELDALAATVDRSRALLDVGISIATHSANRLPPAHALALGLRNAGADASLIAATLGIAPQRVGPLLGVADAKLAKLHAGLQQPDVPAATAEVK
jgi:hypothetical protein